MAKNGETGLHIEYVPLGELKKWERNPREHDLSSLLKSVERFGFVSPPIVDESSGQLVAGHGRLETLERMKAEGQQPPTRIIERDGEWLVPVLRGVSFDNLTEAEAYLIADNRLSDLGGWMDRELAAILSDLASTSEDLLESTGYDADDLAAMLDEMGVSGKDKDEQVILEQAVQLRPAREYIVVVCEGADEFEQLRDRLDLKMVRRGGYKPGSDFDKPGVQRVVKAADLLGRLNAGSHSE